MDSGWHAEESLTERQLQSLLTKSRVDEVINIIPKV